ncbi:hypothetical protein GCM10010205_70270 [Streptomyces nojiriensis]|nr:hypothetical protein GCM10010205_70270 [Streptomyces nojiriensis]
MAPRRHGGQRFAHGFAHMDADGPGRTRTDADGRGGAGRADRDGGGARRGTAVPGRTLRPGTGGALPLRPCRVRARPAPAVPGLRPAPFSRPAGRFRSWAGGFPGLWGGSGRRPAVPEGGTAGDSR